MAFENVSPQALNTAVTLCKNSINYSESQKSLNAIASSTVWQANSKDKLHKSLDKLIHTKYQKILDYLDTISSASSLISKYKKLEEENDDYNHQIYNLQDDLYYEEEETTTEIDEFGQEIETVTTYTVKDKAVESKINELKEKIKENKEEMKTIENEVSSLID